MILTKEIFEKLINEYKFEVENNVARYLGYAVVLYFPESNRLSVVRFGFRISIHK